MDEHEDLQDQFDDEIDQGQDLHDAQLEQYEYGTVPQQKEQHNLYNWFWRVVRLSKPFRLAKVGNLTKVEIGEAGISMRDTLNLAHLGNIFHHKMFGDYFATRSKIIAATSMAKDGWFMDLSISQKKVRQRSKSSSAYGGGEKKTWRLFSGKKTEEEQ